MATTKFIPATKVYKEYSIPRSLLRQLVETGKVKCIEKDIGGPNVFRLYSIKDIERFFSEQ